MNKSVKGALVGAVGVALLAGGFGTFATWTDTADVDAGIVKSGELRITATDSPTWSTGSTSPTGTASIASTTSQQVMVPGDKFVMTQLLDVSVTGGIAKAKLTVGGVDWSSGRGYDNGLKITVEYAGKRYTVPGKEPVLTWNTPAEMTALRDAEAATVTFEYRDLGAGQNAQTDWVLDLQDITLTLHQLN